MNESQQMTYYELFEISEDATPAEIKQAYRSLIKEWHPDLNPEKPDAAAITQEINKAYGILSDPLKRASYDEYLSFIRAKVTVAKEELEEAASGQVPEDDIDEDYSGMSFEDYVKNVAGESYSTYQDAFTDENRKFDEEGYKEYVKNKGSVMDKQVNNPALILIGFAACLISMLFLNRNGIFSEMDSNTRLIFPIALLVITVIATVFEVRKRSKASREAREKQMGGNDSIVEANKWFEVWLYPEMPLAECRKVFFDFSVRVDKHILSRFNMMSAEDKKLYADIIELLQECIKFRER